MTTGSQLRENNIEAGILWQPNDAFGWVIGAERGGRVRGVGFGPSPSCNHARSMDDSTPPPTSTATDQRVMELSTQVEAMKEKCTHYDAFEAGVRLMERIDPTVPIVSQYVYGKKFEYKVCCVSYVLDICMCMFIGFGNVDCGPMITENTMLFFPSKHRNIFNNPKSVPLKWNALSNNSLKTVPMRVRYSTVVSLVQFNLQICASIRKLLGLNKDIYWQWKV